MTFRATIKWWVLATVSTMGVISMIATLGVGGINESRADYQPPLLAPEYADEYRNPAGTTEKNLTPKGIYGKDNRIDAYAALETARRLAQSSVAFFSADELVEEDDAYVLKETASLQERMRVCAHEHFARQPSAGFCSGFLVSNDLVITAGHCLDPIKTLVPHSEVRLVFGFAMHNPNDANTRFAKQDVYRIGKVMEYFDEDKDADDPTKKDWGIFKLDRTVLGHIPVDIRQGDTPIGEAVTMIGHPLGLPVKITDGGRVVKDSGGNVLKTNLDAFGGNSGSAVFSTASIKSGNPVVEGILVGGKADFVDPYATCREVKHFGNSEAGELVTKIGLVIQFDDPPPRPAPASDGVDICKVIPELCQQ